MKDVDCIIVVAGMEGTLPSVIATLIDVPVIGVPTSVGTGSMGRRNIGALIYTAILFTGFSGGKYRQWVWSGGNGIGYIKTDIKGTESESPG